MQKSSNKTASAVAARRILSYSAAGAIKRQNDLLVVEEPLELLFNGNSLGIIMRTPGHDAELVRGLLLSEGLIPPGKNQAAIYWPRQNKNIIHAVADNGVAEHTPRSLVMNSSCGLCGSRSIRKVLGKGQRKFSPSPFSASIIARLPQILRRDQQAFSQTGGLHAAGLFYHDCKLLLLREDIGRHNAVDKVVGAVQESEIQTASTLLLVSGRVSFEIIQKAYMAGIPTVAAISAPSSLAVDFARKSGQTLIGFLRDGRFNLYAGKLADPEDPAFGTV